MIIVSIALFACLHFNSLVSIDVDCIFFGMDVRRRYRRNSLSYLILLLVANADISKQFNAMIKTNAIYPNKYATRGNEEWWQGDGGVAVIITGKKNLIRSPGI